MRNGAEFRPPRDPALPGIRKAVRTGDLKQRLRSPLARLLGDPSIAIGSVAVMSFHHKPGVNCRIAYRIVLADGNPLILFGKLHPPLPADTRRKGKGWRRIRSLHMTLRLPSADRALPHLGRLLDPARAVREADWIFPETAREGLSLHAKDLAIEILGYRPSQRCLLRMEAILRGPSERRRVLRFVKVYARPIPPGRLEAARRLGGLRGRDGTSGPPMPEVVGVSQDRRALVCRAVSGAALLEVLSDETARDLLKRLARILQRVHAAPAPLDVPRGPGEELFDLQNSLDGLKAIDLELGTSAESLVAELRRSALHLPGWSYRTVHGDFSHEQVLIKERKVRLLDFDRLGGGDPHLDLGNFAANLMEASRAHRLPQSTARRWIRFFWRAYARVAPGTVDPDVLRWTTSAALLRLVGRPLRRAEAGWSKQAHRILKSAGLILRGDFDHLLPETQPTSSREGPLRLIGRELDPVEGRPSHLAPVEGYVLRKVWPPKREDWLLLYRRGPQTQAGGYGYLRLAQDGSSEWAAFPRDRVLTGLEEAVIPECLLPHLTEGGILPESPAGIKRIRIVGYKPEHRCLLQVELEESPDAGSRPSIFLKFYRSRREASAVRDALESFRGSLNEHAGKILLALPRARLLPQLRAVAVPGMAGRDFLSRLKDLSGTGPAARVARALRTWQDIGFAPSRRHTWDDETAVLERWTDAAGRVFPGIASTLELHLNRLRKRGGETSRPLPSLIHRDFYDRQVLLHRQRVAILDLDLLAVGDPALDAGNFAAHLILRGLQRHGDPRAFENLSVRFVKAYMENDGRDLKRRLELYTDSALLRLACVYALRPGGGRLIHPLLRSLRSG